MSELANPMRTKMGRRVDTLASALETGLALALIAGICLNFVNVLGRYLVDASISGSDEIEIYILIWIAFLGSALVTWRGMHRRMDVLVATASPRVRNLAAIAEVILTGLVAAFVGYPSFLYVRRIFQLGAVSDIAGLPTWIPHSAGALPSPYDATPDRATIVRHLPTTPTSSSTIYLAQET